MRSRRVILAIGAVAVIAAVVAALIIGGRDVTEVETAPVERGDLEIIVSASGAVSADVRTDIYPAAAGTLASIEVTEGQRVSEGDVIATIDPAPLEVQVAQAEAAYAGALAQRDAIGKAVPSSADKDAAQAAVNAAKAAYDLASKAYDAARAGAGGPSAADIADAQTAVTLATAARDAASDAYDAYYTNVYLPAPEPRDPAIETALAALTFARGQAQAELLTAQQGLAALTAAVNNPLAAAQAKVAKDQAYAAYLGALAQKQALSKAGNVSAAIDGADAAVAAAEAALALAEDTLDETTIVAPADGVVVFSTISGSLLGGPAIKPTVGSSVSPAGSPFAVVSFDTVLFTTQVDEADIARVEAGMPARVLLDALTDDVFETVVDRVDTGSVMTVTGGTAFPVYFVLDTSDAEVLLGMNGSVEIAVDTIEDATTIPVEALLEEGGDSYVFRVEDGRAIRTQIEVGRLTDTRVEILSGLEVDQAVIVSNVSGLEDGARVRVP